MQLTWRKSTQFWGFIKKQQLATLILWNKEMENPISNPAIGKQNDTIRIRYQCIHTSRNRRLKGTCAVEGPKLPISSTFPQNTFRYFYES